MILLILSPLLPRLSFLRVTFEILKITSVPATGRFFRLNGRFVGSFLTLDRDASVMNKERSGE